jgi:hypothetical protein
MIQIKLVEQVGNEQECIFPCEENQEYQEEKILSFCKILLLSSHEVE